MKVKTISRNPEDYERQKPRESNRVFRNFDPELHPFERAREYSRTLNAVKLDKVFAKPFIRNLSGHLEGVFSMTKHSTRLSCLISGSCDGEIRVWNIASGLCNLSIKGSHSGFVRGLTVCPDGVRFLSCGSDARVQLWPLAFDLIDKNSVDDPLQRQPVVKSLQVYTGDEVFNGIDHQHNSEWFATVSSQLQIWDVNRSHPLNSIRWGHETQLTVKWNAAEKHVLASSSADKTITLYDSRLKSALRKVTLPGKSNALCWNPREPFNFTCANEDHNLYTFDMRKVDRALGIHKDFVSSVMSVDYNPTGKEFVAGSYDHTVRIFKASEGNSREVFHTRRMNRVFSVLFSQDSKYVISGSDDSNIRIWKV